MAGKKIGQKNNKSISLIALSRNDPFSILPQKRHASGLEENGCISPDSSTSASSSFPFQRKTRLQPNFSNCHACNTRVSNNGKDKLRTLDSEWRIVLLCKKCIVGIKSRLICSYCFRQVSDRDVAVDCGRCCHRIHHNCIPIHRGFGLLSNIGPALFSCVDCWVSKKLIWPSPEYTKSMEDVVKVAKSDLQKKLAAAGKARQKAMIKCKLAGNAAQLATKAVALVASHFSITDSDAELAFKLHREMNTSKRISRILCATNKQSTIVFENPERSVSDSCVGVCAPSIMKKTYKRKPKSQNEKHTASDDYSSTKNVVREPEALVCEVCDNNVNKLEVFTKDQTSCSDRVVGSSWDDNITESGSQFNQEHDEIETAMVLKEDRDLGEALEAKDRFFFHYTRRCCKT